LTFSPICGVKKRRVTPGNWKRVPEKPYAIGIEPFSKPWKKSGKAGKRPPVAVVPSIGEG
jgi:hypothetical protein